jgi:hypothetical protein
MAAKRISDQLKQAINECGKSRYRIAKETGISQAILSRFVRTECGLSLAYYDRLAEYFGLELAPKRKPTKRK